MIFACIPIVFHYWLDWFSGPVYIYTLPSLLVIHLCTLERLFVNKSGGCFVCYQMKSGHGFICSPSWFDIRKSTKEPGPDYWQNPRKPDCSVRPRSCHTLNNVFSTWSFSHFWSTTALDSSHLAAISLKMMFIITSLTRELKTCISAATAPAKQRTHASLFLLVAWC